MYWTLLRTLRPLGAILALSAAVFAQGTPDQVNDPTPDTNFGCGSDGSLLNSAIRQSFVPEADSLVAVELRLAAGPNFPSGGLSAGERGTILRVRTDSPTYGTSTPENVLMEATTTIAGPLSAGDSVLVRWDFDELALTPGTTYYLEWVTPATDVVLGWQGLGTGTYADGQGFSCFGTPWPGGGVADFNFVTYAAGAEEAAEKSCEDLLKELAAQVDALDLSHHKAKALARPLELASRFLEKGKLRYALMAIRIFEHRVRLFAHFRWISHDDGSALRESAQELSACIQERMEPKKKKKSRRSKKITQCSCS